jgi:hypothetical protein
VRREQASHAGAARRGRSRASQGKGRPPTWKCPQEARRAVGVRLSAEDRGSRLPTCSRRDADPDDARGSQARPPLAERRRRRLSRRSRPAPAWARLARRRAARRPAGFQFVGTRRPAWVLGSRLGPRRAPMPALRAERRAATLRGRPCAERGRPARLRSTTSDSSHRSRGRCKCPGPPCWSAPAHGQARRRGSSSATGGSVLSDRGAAQRSGSRAWRGLPFSHNAGASYTGRCILGSGPGLPSRQS